MKTYKKTLFAFIALVAMVMTIGFLGNAQANPVTQANAARGSATCPVSSIDCGPIRAEARTVDNVAQRQGGVWGQNHAGHGVAVRINAFGTGANASNVSFQVNTTTATNGAGFNTATRRTGWFNTNIPVNDLRTYGRAG